MNMLSAPSSERLDNNKELAFEWSNDHFFMLTLLSKKIIDKGYYYVALQIVDAQVILQKFPSLGKLLGQLYENTVILLSG